MICIILSMWVILMTEKDYELHLWIIDNVEEVDSGLVRMRFLSLLRAWVSAGLAFKRLQNGKV